ncbi:hypothetical protein [uncultured Thiodictyon sp.]|uniref:hypothetical protein n=1 Tax=uncultured Thiodictyon sp. TaxID=1846217 RepID=UPI0025EB3AEF|nr:hypothetical protein [uncultured Thiodictyon sp.]
MPCSRIQLGPGGPDFSRFVMGYWRLLDWGLSRPQLIAFIEQGLDLGITTVDHADICWMRIRWRRPSRHCGPRVRSGAIGLCLGHGPSERAFALDRQRPDRAGAPCA